MVIVLKIDGKIKFMSFTGNLSLENLKEVGMVAIVDIDSYNVTTDQSRKIAIINPDFLIGIFPKSEDAVKAVMLGNIEEESVKQ